MSREPFERLRKRAVEIHVEDHLRKRLERGDLLRVKLGLDPTAPDLHVGHLVVLDVLRMFQDDGHTVVLIVGDFTAMIGDPSGRSETRPILTREQVDAAARTYLDQIHLVLRREHPAVFPLLEGTDGSMKMGKSLGNYIGLTEPPEEIYGKTMSIPDTLTEKYLRLVSGLTRQELDAVLAMKPRDAKAALARQLVKRLHGEESAARAEADFDRKFRRREIPEHVAERKVSNPHDLVATLVEVGFA